MTRTPPKHAVLHCDVHMHAYAAAVACRDPNIQFLADYLKDELLSEVYRD